MSIMSPIVSNSSAGSGPSATGPSAGVSTDNAVARWDGTTGSILQNSSIVIDDSGNICAASTATNPLFRGHFIESSTGAVTYPLGLTNGFSTNGSGIGIRFCPTSALNNATGEIIVVRSNTPGAQASYMAFRLHNGTAIQEYLRISELGAIVLPSTITAPGTTSTQVINKPIGRVNAPAAATSVTVTNSLVTANSIINAIAASNVATGDVKNVVAGAGSFVINFTAALSAEMAVNFIVLS